MPSGRTHDRITLWSLPVVAGLTFGQTQSGNLTLLVSGGFLFSGLMFGPDLDIYSRQFQRWGWWRWIWIPYQKTLRHRSFLSHGLIVGTTLRLIYLAGWLGAVGWLGLTTAQIFWGIPWNWQVFAEEMQRQAAKYPAESIALYIGLELGAMSHSLSDWGGSAYKRLKSRGWSGLKRSRVKTKQRKRQSKPRQSKLTPTKNRIK